MKRKCMKERTCCFTGHREIGTNEYYGIKKRTKNIIITLVKKWIIYYGSGGARGYDMLAAETILELKKIYPQIKLILVLPCPEQTKYWAEIDKYRYINIKKYADKVVYTSDHYYRGCMLVRNKHLVNNSKYCICYLAKGSGGTAFTVDYARYKGLEVYNIV